MRMENRMLAINITHYRASLPMSSPACDFPQGSLFLRSIMPEESKTCRGCGKIKHLEQFAKDHRNKDGQAALCKACDRLRCKRYRESFPEKRAITCSCYRRRNPAKLAAYQRDLYRRSPAQRARCAAQAIAQNARRYGRLVPGSCEICGTTENIHGHHADYTKPLEVRWLCYLCHAKVHKQLRKAEK